MDEKMISIDLIQDAKNFLGQANALRSQLNAQEQQRNGIAEQVVRVDAILAFIKNKIGNEEFDKIVQSFIIENNESVQPQK